MQGLLASSIGLLMAALTFVSDSIYVRWQSEGYYAYAVVAALGFLVLLPVWFVLQPKSADSGGNTRLPS
jgi:hypothetical protein